MTYEENTTIVDDYKDSLWGKFLLETIRLDRYNEKPKGWHWFCAFKDLADSDLKEIQQYLPEQHPFKSITPTQSFLVPELNDAIIWLKKELKITENIKVIDFSGRAFKNFDFSFFVFPIKVSFKSASFIGDANFNKATFWGEFNLATADVAKAYAKEHASNSADFTKTIFTGKAKFTETDFRDMVQFSDAEFSSTANFIKAVFFDFTDFNNAIFKSLTSFNSAKFSHPISFDGAEFLKSVDFSNAIFSYGIIFNNIKTKSSVNFTKTKFKKNVPSFYKAELYPNIIWNWDVNLWPQTGKRKNDIDITGKNQETRITDNQNAYENLSAQMKNLDKYHDEHFFYRQEMRCRRWLTRYPAKCFYWLYEKFSEYGYGIKQALLWWAVHIFAGMIAISILSLINSWLECWKDGVWEAVKSASCSIPVSFANAHGFLSFYKGPLEKCYMELKMLNGFNAIWGIQTILGILFLFLLVLTVRIRFRLK